MIQCASMTWDAPRSVLEPTQYTSIYFISCIL